MDAMETSHSLAALAAQPRRARRRTRPAIRLLEHRVLRGCNVHHSATVLRQRVDLGAFAGLHTGEADPSFADRFLRRFAALDEPAARGHMSEEFLARLRSAVGVPVEEALFEAILAVERSMALTMRRVGSVDHAEIARGSATPTKVDFIWTTRAPGMSRAAARVGLAGLSELLLEPTRAGRPGPKSFDARLAVLRKRAKRRQWSATAAALALAAEKRGLPCETLGDAYLLLGQGVEQHVVYAKVMSKEPTTESESALAARIPIALIAGTRGTSSIALELDALLRAAGKAVGLAAPKRMSVCGEPLRRRRDAARFLLHDPRVGMLVATASPQRIISSGLRVDRCSVAAVAEVEPRLDREAYKRAIEVVLKGTSGCLVIGADDAVALAATRTVAPERLVLCAWRENRAVRQHAALGGSVVVCKSRGGERIELQRAGEVHASVPVTGLGAHARGRRRIRARMFAVALAFGLGLSTQELARAVERRRYLQP
jgi:hypothetical protein